MRFSGGRKKALVRVTVEAQTCDVFFTHTHDLGKPGLGPGPDDLTTANQVYFHQNDLVSKYYLISNMCITKYIYIYSS